MDVWDAALNAVFCRRLVSLVSSRWWDRSTRAAAVSLIVSGLDRDFRVNPVGYCEGSGD